MKFLALYPDSYEYVDGSMHLVEALLLASCIFRNGYSMGLTGYSTLYDDEFGSLELIYQDGICREETLRNSLLPKYIGKFSRMPMEGNVNCCICRFDNECNLKSLLRKDIEYIENVLREQ